MGSETGTTQSKSQSGQGFPNNNEEIENDVLNFKNYWNAKEFTGLTSSIDQSLDNIEESDEEIEFMLLCKKRIRENNTQEKDEILEDKKGKIKCIKNIEDKLFSLEKFEKNENKIYIYEIKEEKEGESSGNNKKNDIGTKKYKKKKIFEILKIRREEKKKNTQFGRIKKEEKDKGNNGNHNRDSEDNKMRKIKSYFGKSLYIFIRDNFIENNEFLKLEISINKNLNKKFNEDLFNMTLKDIYFNYEISNKYVHFDKDTNKKLINKIYEEQKEIVVIKILNLTYIEAFDIFRRKIKKEKDLNPELKNKINGTDILDNKKFKDFDCFIEKIREEEKNNKNGDIEEYINDIKRLCLNFEEWFGQKIGRNRQNNKKKKFNISLNE